MKINMEKLKSKGFSVFIIVLFLAVVVVLNVFVSMLTERFFLKADLTDTGIYTLSDRAAEYLADVNEAVDVIILSEESAWRANATFDMVGNILRNYSASSGGSIKIQYVNPDLNSFDGPAYNNSLTELKESYTELEDMTRNNIIFLSSRRAALISVSDLFAQSADNFGRPVITGLRADQELIGALTYVLNEQIARIVFLNNHQENPKEHIQLFFERTGYVSSSINLALEEIPDDTVVLVSSAPKFDFLNEEIIKLEQFLALGGNVIILYDANVPQLPMLENFLAEWGISVDNKLIFDEDFTVIPQVGVIAVRAVAGELPFTNSAEQLTTTEMPLGVFLPFPLRSHGVRGGFTVLPLVQTFSASSYAKDIGSGGLTTIERESGDESGPFTIAYNVRRMTRNAENNQVVANLIVAGDTMFDDSFLAMYGNSFFNSIFISSIAIDLNPFGNRIFIPAKDLSDSQMLVSASGSRNILIIMVIVLPLLIIAAGVFVWRKRRHL